MTTLKQLYRYHLTPGGPNLSRKIFKNANLQGDELQQMSILVVGCRHGENVFSLAEIFPGTIQGIDEDPEAVFSAKLIGTKLAYDQRVRFKFMSPLKLDFSDASFDLVLLEGILSAYPKQKALTETRRVLKQDGIIGISDSFWLQTPVPTYIRDVWESPDNKIVTKDELGSLLLSAGFEMLWSKEVSGELASFYRQFTGEVRDIARSGFEGMKHMKSLVKHYKHEIDVYLKHGGDKFMGYLLLTAKKIGTLSPSESERRIPEETVS